MNTQYCILPGSYLYNDEHLKLHNKAFLFWCTSWAKVFNNLPSPVDVKHFEFRRQTFVAILFNRSEEIIGMTLHTLFNLNSLADCHHNYFKNNYSCEFLQELKNANYSKVMTIEYLTVSEKFRRGELGFSVATHLVALAHRLQSHLEVEAAVSSCRRDVKIDLLEEKFGGKVLNTSGFHYGIETQNLITPTRTLHEPKEITFLSDILWNNRLIVNHKKYDEEYSNSKPLLQNSILM